MEILARSVGRRKEAVSQVQLVRGTGKFIINEKSAEIYLQNNTFSLLKINSPLEALSSNFSTQKISEAPLATEQDLKKTPILQARVSGGDSRMAGGLLNPANIFNQLDIIVKVKGGGLIGQAEAIKLAVARALCQIEQASTTVTIETASLELDSVNNKESRKILKLKGYLTQDARVKERRKYGLKKARKAPQYSKR